MPKRFWLISGFAISVISVVVNAVVISNIGSETDDLKREYSFAKDRLVELSSSLVQAEAKFDTYKVLHHLAYLLPGERKDAARDDAMYMLSEYLANGYGAANDIPAIDLYEAKTIEIKTELDSLLKLKALYNRKLKETDPQKLKEIQKEVDAVPDPDELEATTPLGKKLKAVRKTAEIEATTEGWFDWTLEFVPTQAAFREQTAASIKRQKAKVARLEKEIEELDHRSNLVKYIGIGLQMLGLLLVLAESFGDPEKS